MLRPTEDTIRRWLFPALRWVRIGLLLLLDSIASLRPRLRGDAAVVVRLDAIGDFVIWLQHGAADIALELRKTHPRVILLANSAWAAMARDLGVWDEVFPVDPARFVRDPSYRFATLCAIRRLGFSTLVQPRAARLFLLEDAIVRACGAPERVGSAALSANMPAALKALGDRYYSTIVAVPLDFRIHESMRDRAFASGCCEVTGGVVHASRLPAPRELASFPPGRFFAVAVGAGWSGRQWPIEKFAALLSDLHAAHGLVCAVVGSAGERPLVRRLLALTSAPIADYCGRLSLTETVQLIQRSSLLIANESGPLHIGVWCGTPVIGLVGGGHFGWFAPYPSDAVARAPIEIAFKSMPCFHCNWHCKFDVPAGQAVPCVRDIDGTDVFRRAHRLLCSAS